MLTWLTISLLLSQLATAAPAPQGLEDQPTIGNGTVDPSDLLLPSADPDPSERAVEIQTNRQGYIYAPSLIGNTSFFIGGDLGAAKVQNEVNLWTTEQQTVVKDAPAEQAAAIAAVGQGGNLTSPAKYELLYDGQWVNTNPDGVAPGSFTNYTQDLFFSMERLSSNAFTIGRLNPATSKIPFTVSDTIVKKLAGGKTLQQLFLTGRLFVSDHSYAAASEYRDKIIAGRYLAACTALFYQHPTSNDLLPLAIATNVGAKLVYTPEDTPADWLLAKMMFNANDLFHGQIYHLASSHAVAEIVHLAAMRSFAPRHPVFAFLDRVMYRAYAIRPIGSKILFNPGGLFDSIFALSAEAARVFATQFYPTSVGKFQSNYLATNLKNRGLLDPAYGPALKSNPFWEDGKKLTAPIRAYATKYVNNFYANDAAVKADSELQAWVVEANGPAAVVDFPAKIVTRSVLIEALTHMAYLTGLNHHALNQGAPFATAGVLPFHPAALYKEIPTEKGVSDVTPWLPPLKQSVAQVQLLALFNRPEKSIANETLVDMFTEPRLEAYVKADTFRSSMTALDTEIKSKTFDAKGLCQGMPFVWRTLAPKRIPFFLSV